MVICSYAGEGLWPPRGCLVYQLPKGGYAAYKRPELSLTLSFLRWKMGIIVPPSKMAFGTI